jgi:hypothetical protein
MYLLLTAIGFMPGGSEYKQTYIHNNMKRQTCTELSHLSMNEYCSMWFILTPFGVFEFLQSAY